MCSISAAIAEQSQPLGTSFRCCYIFQTHVYGKYKGEKESEVDQDEQNAAFAWIHEDDETAVGSPEPVQSKSKGVAAYKKSENRGAKIFNKPLPFSGEKSIVDAFKKFIDAGVYTPIRSLEDLSVFQSHRRVDMFLYRLSLVINDRTDFINKVDKFFRIIMDQISSESTPPVEHSDSEVTEDDVLSDPDQIAQRKRQMEAKKLRKKEYYKKIQQRSRQSTTSATATSSTPTDQTSSSKKPSELTEEETEELNMFKSLVQSVVGTEEQIMLSSFRWYISRIEFAMFEQRYPCNSISWSIDFLIKYICSARMSLQSLHREGGFPANLLPSFKEWSKDGGKLIVLVAAGKILRHDFIRGLTLLLQELCICYR